MLDYLVAHSDKGLLIYEMGWHETYLVAAGQYEAVYGNMPPHGLGKVGRLTSVGQSSSARNRLGASVA